MENKRRRKQDSNPYWNIFHRGDIAGDSWMDMAASASCSNSPATGDWLMKLKVTMKDFSKIEMMEGCLKEADRMMADQTKGLSTINWGRVENVFTVEFSYFGSNALIDWQLERTFAGQVKQIDKDAKIEKIK